MGSRRDSGACPEQPSEGAAGQRGRPSGAPHPPLASCDVDSWGTIHEIPVPGTIPRFEIPAWRECFGVVAGITSRGSELGPGFDLGLWSKQPVGEVMSRWLAFRREMLEFPAIALANQVHGVEVMSLDRGRGWIYVDGIDGWITTTPGTLLAVTVADCIPVYLVVPEHGVALLHAGWRGAAGGILERGVARLLEATGSSASTVVMHCGVGICGNCYEVGHEVLTRCGMAADGAGPWHLDLRDHLRSRAKAVGLTQVTSSSWCSAHHGTDFYSHRASKGKDGRMVAYLGLLPRGLPAQLPRLAPNPLPE